MANLASNPWSFVSSDVMTASPAASPTGLILNPDGSVSLTTAVAHGFISGQYVTVIGATNSLYNGFYFVLFVPTMTTAVLVPRFSGQTPIPLGTAASGGGTIALNQYRDNVRGEDLSWQNVASAGDTIDIRDRNGNIIWQATAPAAGTQNRGKIFWVDGITPITITSGIVILTVN